MKDHEKECECFSCKNGEESLHELEQKMIEKYGWYCHIIIDNDEQSPTGFNAHTHNLQEKYNHPDIQIVVPINHKSIIAILHSIVDNYIKKGNTLKEGEEYDKIIQYYKVTFFNTKECGRNVLRLILPDVNGYIQQNEPMDKNFSLQYE